MTTKPAIRLTVCAITLPLLAGLALPAQAQDLRYRSIARYRIKPERSGDFMLNVKEYISVMKKANPDRTFSMWRSETGPSEYVLVSYHAKYAELDQTMAEDPKMKDVAAQLASIGARINACVESGERYVDEIMADLSLPRSSEIPKAVRMIRSKVKPDQISNYTNLIKSEILPAHKKAGSSLFLVSRARYGRPGNEFFSVSALNNWATLDSPAPLVQAMGDAAYQKYLAKAMALLDEFEVNVYRHLPDLSYAPAK